MAPSNLPQVHTIPGLERLPADLVAFLVVKAAEWQAMLGGRLQPRPAAGSASFVMNKAAVRIQAFRNRARRGSQAFEMGLSVNGLGLEPGLNHFSGPFRCQ